MKTASKNHHPTALFEEGCNDSVTLHDVKESNNESEEKVECTNVDRKQNVIG